MARKANGKRGARGAPHGERWARRLVGWFGRVAGRGSPRTYLLGAAVVLALGGFLFARHLTREAYAWEVFRVDPFRGIEVERPDDAPQTWLAELSRAAARIRDRGPISIFSAEHVEAVREEISHVPWVRRVDEIERRFPDRLFVRLVARRPVARVIHRDRAEWVDAEGVLLPPPAASDDAALKKLGLLPAIFATRSASGVRLPTLPLVPPTPLYGAAVEDPRFLAACATAAALEELGLAARLPDWRLAWIETPDFDPSARRREGAADVPRSEVALVFVPAKAERRTLDSEAITLRVDWGEPPAHAGYEPPRGREFLASPELRLLQLEKYVLANPGCERSHHVTVRFGGAIAREAPASPASESPR